MATASAARDRLGLPGADAMRQSPPNRQDDVVEGRALMSWPSNRAVSLCPKPSPGPPAAGRLRRPAGRAVPRAARGRRAFACWLAIDARGGKPPIVAAEVTNAGETFELVSSGPGMVLLSSGNAALYRRPGVITCPVRGSAQLGGPSRTVYTSEHPRPPSRVIRPQIIHLCAAANDDRRALTTVHIGGYRLSTGTQRKLQFVTRAQWLRTPAESGAADSCSVHGDGRGQIVRICTFTQAAVSRVVEVAAQEAVLKEGFSARR